MTGWHLQRRTAPAGTLHAESASLIQRPTGRVARVARPTSRALVLGSSQRRDGVDLETAARLGIDVVARRSGGGAVLVGDDDVIWVDLVIPAGDPLWDDDVGRAPWWVGSLWARALDLSGLSGAEMRRGPMHRPVPGWSAALCFAALGPGEVVVDGRKVVGVSQRRSRYGALFQSAALVRWDPGTLVDLFGAAAGDRPRLVERLGELALGIGASCAAPVVDALVASLPG